MALAVYFVLEGQLNADEGFYLLASRLVRDGFRPYQDFGFTQGPVLPYINVPWLEVFGYSLIGQRFANLCWMGLSIALGVWGLARRKSWTCAILFVAALLGAPSWIAFAVKGKTYAFAGLCVLTAILALLSKQRLWFRWLVFGIAAALGVGSRYPVAGFFLPAGIGLLLLTLGWRARVVAGVWMIFCAGFGLYFAAADDWSNFVFWTAQFHRAVLFHQAIAHRLADAFRYAPAVWLVCIYGLGQALRAGTRTETIAIGSLLAGTLGTLCGSAAFAEYVMPFVPASAWLAAGIVADGAPKLPKIASIGLIAFIPLAGWNLPPALSKDVAAQSLEATAFLRAHVAWGAAAIGTMPEIPIAAGLKVPPAVAMGKYGVSEDFPAEIARRRHILTPADLCELLAKPSIQAVVLSPTLNWNYSTSVPSYRALSNSAQTQILAALKRGFRVGYANDFYVVLLRGATQPQDNNAR